MCTIGKAFAEVKEEDEEEDDGEAEDRYATLERVITKVNSVIYQNALVQLAGERARKLAEFKDDDKIQKMTFSVGYCSEFLQHHKLGRHRISSHKKVRNSTMITLHLGCQLYSFVFYISHVFISFSFRFHLILLGRTATS